MNFGRFVRRAFAPENLRKVAEVARRVAQGADFAAMHECSSQCWHFPGFEGPARDRVRCTCRWEEGIDRLYNGSSHAETCWVHRIYLERGGLEAGASCERVEPGLWQVRGPAR